MRNIFLTIIALISLTAPALSADQCFEVVNHGQGLNSAIKINKCTGESWALRQVDVSGGTSIRWFPLLDDTREPVLNYRSSDAIGGPADKR